MRPLLSCVERYGLARVSNNQTIVTCPGRLGKRAHDVVVEGTVEMPVRGVRYVESLSRTLGAGSDNTPMLGDSPHNLK